MRPGKRREDGRYENRKCWTEPKIFRSPRENWLAQFETALSKSDHASLKTLFHPDSYWRDVLALSWNIQTINGADAILRELKAHAGRAAPALSRSIPTAPRRAG